MACHTDVLVPIEGGRMVKDVPFVIGVVSDMTGGPLLLILG